MIICSNTEGHREISSFAEGIKKRNKTGSFFWLK